MNCGIYGIFNKMTGKWYVGSSVNISGRWYDHKNRLHKNRHGNSHLQAAWNKYWEINFEFYIIESCEKKNITEREQYWIDKFDSCDTDFGYNIRAIVKAPPDNRNIEKWPHANGKKCKCNECHETRRLQKNEWYKNQVSKTKFCSSRKIEKWPCEDGCYCKCDECVIQRRKIRNEYANKPENRAKTSAYHRTYVRVMFRK